ncbi:acyl carrier protein [Actinoplanes awajinensis]|uniref:acyl carrier protein n=1 Tax=Actinoplanes awajinensis TaxID=135946 RepID=UPI0018DE48EE|nr:acyl carrier protein [Actinoplanes awajinensis]WKD80529.1 acyl carrier protein [Actinoplanes awajinensis subsp. mycoplanecinus]
MNASPDAVRALVAGVLRIDEERVDILSGLVDLGATSIAVMEIIVEVEDSFSVELTDEQMDEVVTVEDLVRLINKSLDERAARR